MKWMCFILCVLTCAQCKTQASIPHPTQNMDSYLISANIIEAAVDKLGFIYIVDDANILTKYNEKGKKIFEYNNKRLGQINTIDISSALTIMVYYKDMGIIKILDNTLNEIKTINLYEGGLLTSVVAACNSNDGNFWVYDLALQRAIKIDNTNVHILETNQFYDLGLHEFEASRMMERGNLLSIMGTKAEMVIFDNFGQWQKSSQYKDLLDFYQRGGDVLLTTKHRCVVEAIKNENLTERGFDFKTKGVKRVIFENDLYYIIRGEGLEIAKIK